jgi:argininosuccinate lyase
MFTDAMRALRLLSGAMESVEIDPAEMARRAAKDFLTVTELADTLVRREKMSFREAHALVGQVVRACGRDDSPSAITAALLALRPSLRLAPEEIKQALDPVHFVRIRNIVGGPAPERTAEALAQALSEQREIDTWIDAKTTLLDDAQAGLRQQVTDQP